MTSEQSRKNDGSDLTSIEGGKLEAGEVAVCPHCIAPITLLADFCNKCGAPLTSLAAMDPLKQVYAQGWVYRRAVSRPASFIMLLGLWLIFGPTLLVNLVSFFMLVIKGGSIAHGNLTILAIVLWLATLMLHASILYFATSRYFRLRAIPVGHCMECGYNLYGLPEPRCPECGTPFDPEDMQEADDSDEGPGEYDQEFGEVPDAQEPEIIPTPRSDLVYVAMLGFGWLILAAASCLPKPDRHSGSEASIQTYLTQIGIVVICAMTVAGAAMLATPDRKKRSPLFKCLFWLNFVPGMLLCLYLLDYLGKS